MSSSLSLTNFTEFRSLLEQIVYFLDQKAHNNLRLVSRAFANHLVPFTLTLFAKPRSYNLMLESDQQRLKNIITCNPQLLSRPIGPRGTLIDYLVRNTPTMEQIEQESLSFETYYHILYFRRELVISLIKRAYCEGKQPAWVFDLVSNDLELYALCFAMGPINVPFVSAYKEKLLNGSQEEETKIRQALEHPNPLLSDRKWFLKQCNFEYGSESPMLAALFALPPEKPKKRRLLSSSSQPDAKKSKQ